YDLLEQSSARQDRSVRFPRAPVLPVDRRVRLWEGVWFHGWACYAPGPLLFFAEHVQWHRDRHRWPALPFLQRHFGIRSQEPQDADSPTPDQGQGRVLPDFLHAQRRGQLLRDRQQHPRSRRQLELRAARRSRVLADAETRDQRQVTTGPFIRLWYCRILGDAG